MVTGPVTSSVPPNAIVHTPKPSHPVPVTLNAIVSAPAAAFASATAWASEPAPDGLVLVTVKIAASAAPAAPESERPRMKRTAVFMALLSPSMPPSRQPERLDQERRHLAAVRVGQRAIVAAAAARGDV